MPVHSVLNYTLQAALSLADIAELKSFCGVHGLLRYMGPQNGGVSADTQAAYAVLLKLILKCKSSLVFRHVPDGGERRSPAGIRGA